MTVKTLMQNLTLREKIGQTGIPAPNALRDGVKKHGSYAAYFSAVPFSGLYVAPGITGDQGETVSRSADFRDLMTRTSDALRVPLLVSADAELGGAYLFRDFHPMPRNMAVGAAGDEALTRQLGYYWAKELKTAGIFWPFGPVCDLVSGMTGLFSSHVLRCFSDDPALTARLACAFIQGAQEAGVAACGKHYPGHGHEYRDSHFSSTVNELTLEQWENSEKRVWDAVIASGVKSIMSAHTPCLCLDDSYARGVYRRPSSASKKVLDYLHRPMSFSGLTVTDAVSMKCLAAAFDHDDIYTECFHAGNDIVLFVHDDYLDVMEQAVQDGQISMDRLDDSVERILAFKQALGLLDRSYAQIEPFTADDSRAYESCCYEIARRSLTLVNNTDNKIPYDVHSVRHVTIVAITQYDPFIQSLDVLKKELERRGVCVDITDAIQSKEHLKTISHRSDIIINACYMDQARPYGFPGYSREKEMATLFDSLSFGAEKTVVVSFGLPSIYYHYFESADRYVNAYSDSPQTMQAFAAALFGEIPLTGQSPMALRPFQTGRKEEKT